MGTVFQRGALFSSLSVLDNVALPLIEHTALTRPDAQRLARVKLTPVGLPSDAVDKAPALPSGGVIKCVALARALGLTVFLVTHDLDTLCAICDRVAVLSQQPVIAVGPLPEVANCDDRWIGEYFRGPHGKAALAAMPQLHEGV